jgi:hypothetical protein
VGCGIERQQVRWKIRGRRSVRPWSQNGSRCHRRRTRRRRRRRRKRKKVRKRR